MVNLRAKMKWVSKYVSRPLIIIIFLVVCAYYLNDAAHDYIEKYIGKIVKLGFWFFLIKGLLWIVVGVLAWIEYKSKKKEKNSTQSR